MGHREESAAAAAMGGGRRVNGGGGPRLTQEEQDRIDKIACFVARDRDGQLTELLLQRLLRLTNNHRRWGFMSPEHPHYVYYHRRKVSERCRLMRPPPPLQP